MKKKILIVASIILIIIIATCVVIYITLKNTNLEITEIAQEDIEAPLEESIIVQNNIDNTVATDIETEEEIEEDTQDEIMEDTREENKIVQETKETSSSQSTETTTKVAESTKEETSSVETQTTSASVSETSQTTTSNEQTETISIDLSKYDYYEQGANGTYKGFIKDTAGIANLKSLINSCISEFGYTSVTLVEDSSLFQSGAPYFTANKTNVANMVYDSEGFSIHYYAVKEYNISANGTETLFQTRSYIKVK